MATVKLVDFDHVTDYISREAAWNGIYSCPTKTDADGYIWVRTKDVAHMIDEIPAADVVPWEWLERYADYFCAGVSMPEFVREAKMFYEGTNEAMKEGVIDG